jgi:formylglycine-generating enzyme required for sulfatase activity
MGHDAAHVAIGHHAMHAVAGHHEHHAPALATPAPPLVATRARADWVRIPGGRFIPLFQMHGEREATVHPFLLDRRPVTRGEFLDFVRANPLWRRGQASRALADEHYLADWPGELDAGTAEDLDRPVTQVSRYAAEAYCKAAGARLPGAVEWEYTAAASATERDASHDPAFQQWLLERYTRPAPRRLPVVGTGFRNAYGVEDLHGALREWVAEDDHPAAGHEAHWAGEHQLNCAGGALGATRTDDYPAFLRHTFRSGLEGLTTVDNLGFRCARSL